MGKIQCDICKKKCRGDVLKLDKRFIHKKCFNCSGCGENLEKGGFFYRDSKYYCNRDYQKKFGVKCGMCGEYVDGEIVTILGGSFHIQCFKCNSCSKPFNCGDRATLWDKQYLCDTCASMKEKENISPTIVRGDNEPVECGGQSEFVVEPIESSIGMQHAVPYMAPVDSSDTETGGMRTPVTSTTLTNGTGKGNKQQILHIDAQNNGIAGGYISTDSGVEKTKSEMAYMSQHSPEYSTTSGDESWVHSSRARKLCKTMPYQFGKYYTESYLKIRERTEKAVPPRSLYGGGSLNGQHHAGAPPPSHSGYYSSGNYYRNPQFHRPSNFSYRSNPNIHMKKGMSLLVSKEPHMWNTAGTHPRDRHQNHYIKSMSMNGGRGGASNSNEFRPQSSVDLSLTEEVKRLAHFPNATEPDETYQVPIERYDFPAPPSLSVIILDKKRESRSTRASGLPIQSTGDISSAANASTGVPDLSGLEEGLGLDDSGGGGLDDDDELKVRHVKRQRQLEELRMLRNRSGMSKSLLDDLEEKSMKQEDLMDQLNVDPISASRSPGASIEPHQKPRFDRHTFTSPSRDSRFEGRPIHSVSSKMNYSSTGGRIGTLSGYLSATECDSVIRSLRGYRPFDQVSRGYMSCVEHTSGQHRDGAVSGTETGSRPHSILNLRSLSMPRGDGASSSGGRGGVSGRGGTASISSGGGAAGATGVLIGRPIGSGAVGSGGAGTTRMGGINGHMTPSMTTSGYSMDAATRSIDESTLIGGSGVISGAALDSTAGTSAGAAATGGCVTFPATESSMPGSHGGHYRDGYSSDIGGRYHHNHHPNLPFHQRMHSHMQQHHPNHHHSGREEDESDWTMYDTDTGAIIELLDSQYPTVQSYLRPSINKFMQSREKIPPQIYPYETLKISNFSLPKGVDRDILEIYLSDQDFELVFQMPKSAFNRLPNWKKNDLKKKADLY